MSWVNWLHNCYLVICRDSKEAIVIDPGGDPARFWMSFSGKD